MLLGRLECALWVNYKCTEAAKNVANGMLMHWFKSNIVKGKLRLCLGFNLFAFKFIILNHFIWDWHRITSEK